MERPARRWAALIALVALIAGPAHSRADDPADVDKLIQLVQSRPAGMTDAEWKEKRREAARELGRLGDRRAVPPLIRVVETEKFDVVAEIAIEALGRLGDKRAVDVLRQVYADPSRDKYVRDGARAALQRLGVDPDRPDAPEPTEPGVPDARPDGAPDSDVSLLGRPTVLGDGSRVPVTEGPRFADDVLAVSEQLTFAVGNLTMQYDTVRESPNLDGSVSGSYRRVLEGERMAYYYGGSADVVAGVVEFEGDDNGSKLVTAAAGFDGGARFHISGGDAYAHVGGAANTNLSWVRIDVPDADDISQTRTGADIHASLGAGYGRVLDVGEGLRLRRIEKVLADARMLGRPITPDLARKLMRVWWGLRGELGTYRRLLATVQVLRDGGVLLGEPDAATTYKILEVLRDGQLAHRPSGYTVRLGLGESYLLRDEDTPVANRVDGRVESVFATAMYGLQLGAGTGEIVGEGYARLRVLAPDDQTAPWSAGAALAWRNYFYSDYYDPIGALDIRGEVGASDDGVGDEEADPNTASHVATRVGGQVGWAWSPNRASQFRLAASVVLESDEIFVGMTFSAAYGWLDVSYLGNAGLPAAFQ